MTGVIKVYSTTHCPYCVMAKKYLESRNVEFQEINVENDQEKAAEMIEKSGQMGVPVLEINGEIIVGFNRPEIDRALEKKK